MLRSLHIENYALIKSLDMNFFSGLSVITGETGAGKSILLGALGLALGKRADLKSIKNGASKCIIEAVFDISNYNLQYFFKLHDLDYEQECILRRELTNKGKSRMFLNDTPVNTSILKQLANKLLDIHSQHENLLLKDNLFQLEVVDHIAENSELLKEYQATYTAYKQKEKELDQLITNAKKAKEDYDYLQYQFQQLEDAQLIDGEQKILEEEQNNLEHASEIKMAISKSSSLMNDDNNGLLEILRSTKNTIQSIAEFGEQFQSIANRLSSTFIELKDIDAELENLNENTDINPARIEEINQRISLIYTLLQKHKKNSINELLTVKDNYEEKLYKVDNAENDILKLKIEKKALYLQLQQKGEKLSTSRKKAAKRFEKQLVEKLSPLGMQYVQFIAKIQTSKEAQAMGLDTISFLFSANKNSPLQEVTQIASGGETARLMLCIKSLIATASNLPTIIFDEIDTGISGEIASKTAVVLQEMSKEVQVICISHLPQIASKGSVHYKIYKEDSSETTKTHVVQLEENERAQEIAKMLSGAQVTDAALQNAHDLLKGS